MENLKTKEVQESINLNLDIKKAKNIEMATKMENKKALEETNKWYENFYNKRI